MQYEKFINNIEKLKNVKEVLDAQQIEFSDGDELYMQHMNAEINKFMDLLKIKISNKVGI